MLPDSAPCHAGRAGLRATGEMRGAPWRRQPRAAREPMGGRGGAGPPAGRGGAGAARRARRCAEHPLLLHQTWALQGASGALSEEGAGRRDRLSGSVSSEGATVAAAFTERKNSSCTSPPSVRLWLRHALAVAGTDRPERNRMQKVKEEGVSLLFLQPPHPPRRPDTGSRQFPAPACGCCGAGSRSGVCSLPERQLQIAAARWERRYGEAQRLPHPAHLLNRRLKNSVSKNPNSLHVSCTQMRKASEWATLAAGTSPPSDAVIYSSNSRPGQVELAHPASPLRCKLPLRSRCSGGIRTRFQDWVFLIAHVMRVEMWVLVCLGVRF